MLSDDFADGTLFGTSSGNLARAPGVWHELREFGTSTGTGTANGAGSATFTIGFVITGGTGIFDEAEGEVTLTGTITQTGPTTEAIRNGSYTGSFTIVPEPSTLGLFGAGLALVCAVGICAGAKKESV